MRKLTHQAKKASKKRGSVVHEKLSDTQLRFSIQLSVQNVISRIIEQRGLLVLIEEAAKVMRAKVANPPEWWLEEAWMAGPKGQGPEKEWEQCAQVLEGVAKSLPGWPTRRRRSPRRSHL